MKPKGLTKMTADVQNDVDEATTPTFRAYQLVLQALISAKAELAVVRMQNKVVDTEKNLLTQIVTAALLGNARL